MVKLKRERVKLHETTVALSKNNAHPTRVDDLSLNQKLDGLLSKVSNDALQEDILSRGQRKRRERRMKQLRKLDFAGSMLAEQKRASLAPRPLDSVKSLAEELFDIEKSMNAGAIHMGMQTTVGKGLTKKKRQRIMREESEQFRAVINHPLFQNNPLGTITEHLVSVIKAGVELNSDTKTKSSYKDIKDKNAHKKVKNINKKQHTNRDVNMS